MTTDEIIRKLRYRAEGEASAEETKQLLTEAADRLEELDERVAIMSESKTGKWERLTGMAPPEYHGHRICSICECFAPYDPLHMGREILPKYCPGCGAKMEGTEP
jgi:hypothetical protein